MTTYFIQVSGAEVGRAIFYFNSEESCESALNNLSSLGLNMKAGMRVESGEVPDPPRKVMTFNAHLLRPGKRTRKGQGEAEE